MNEYLVGDIVWAKLMGYPWWPAKVVDEKSLNKRVLAAKPKSSSTVWPVLFFGSFDYGWFGHENLCYFDEGLAEHGSLNRRGNLFAQAVKQAQDPQNSDESEESDEKPVKSSNKRSARPGSQNVPRNLKRNTSPVPKEKKAKIEKVTSEPASSDLSHSSHSSPVRRTPAKRSRPVLSRNSKETASNKTTKPISEEPSKKVPEHSASETMVQPSSPPKSPLPMSPKPHQSGKKNEDEDVPEDILEMRALRVSLQKATFPANYKDPELINKILTTLENGVFSPQCIIAAKMAKLMRHIQSHNIPKNKYNFGERIRLLGIRFKAAIDPKTSDSIEDSKVSESAVQSSAIDTKSNAKSDKSSSFVETTSDRDSETGIYKKKEIDDAILSLIDEPTEKNVVSDYSSEKNILKKPNSDIFSTDLLSNTTKSVADNTDSSGIIDSVNLSKELVRSKSEDILEENSTSHQTVSEIINSRASSPHKASSLTAFEDNDVLNSDTVLKPESSHSNLELEGESTTISLQGNSDRGQKVTIDENLSGESNLDNLSDSVPLSSKIDAAEISLTSNTGSETNFDNHETDLESTSLDQTPNKSSTQNLDGATGPSEEQTISPVSSQNKDLESNSNQEQISPDEAKVEIPHDAEKEASTVSPPSVASPVIERASITADSPSSSRATIASL